MLYNHLDNCGKKNVSYSPYKLITDDAIKGSEKKNTFKSLMPKLKSLT